MIIQDQEQKHVTGHVGSGNMKLVEFTDLNPQEQSVNFDVADDMHFHMKNDAMFYRKKYLPFLDTIAKSANDEEQIENGLQDLLDSCYEHYCQKYKIDVEKDVLLGNDIKEDIKQRVRQDAKLVKKGEL